MAEASRKSTEFTPSVKFITEYRHYRTGKLMRAEDYGWKAWPIRANSDSPKRKKAA